MTSADLVVFMGCRAGSTTTGALGGAGSGLAHRAFRQRSDGAGRQFTRPKSRFWAICGLPSTSSMPRSMRARMPAPAFAARRLPPISAGASSRPSCAMPRPARRPLRPERVVATLAEDPAGNRDTRLRSGHDLPVFLGLFSPCRVLAAISSPTAPTGLWVMRSRPRSAAWYGRPDSKVVALMGDGSFGFTAGELENHLPRAGARSPSW